MSLGRVAAVARHDLRALARDPTPVVALVVLPLVAIPFVRPLLKIALAHEGFKAAGGEVQAVPGLAVMFAFFLVAFGGFSFYLEHEWGTWPRLQTSAAATLDVVLGKLLVVAGVALLQLTVLFGIAQVAFGLDVASAVPSLAAIGLALSLVIAALTATLVALCHSVRQFNAVALLVAIVFAGFGGAFAPTELLPDWASSLAPATPGYWAIKGFRSAILNHGWDPDVWRSVAALLGFALVFTLMALWRYDAGEAKLSWN